MSEPQGAMFDEFVETGFLDDSDVKIKTARFIQWDYKGKQPQPVLGLQFIFADKDGKDHDEVLSCGELRFFVPSNDGRKALPVGTQNKLNINTNAVAFLISLMNADTKGELTAKLKSGDDIGVLDGTMLHVSREPQPKRSGIVQTAGAPGQPERPQTRLKVDKILAYPWESGASLPPARPIGAGPVAAPAAAATTAAAPAAGGADFATAAGTLLGLIAAAGGSIKKTGIAGKAFASDELKAMPVAQKNAMLAVLVSEAFHNSQDVKNMGITYDPGTGTLTLG